MAEAGIAFIHMRTKIRPAVKLIRLHLDLMKLPLSLLIAVSAVFGFVLRKNHPGVSIFLTGAGVFILACGGAALNNFQDRHIDRLLSRTKNRPLPAGHLLPKNALILSAVLIPAGLSLLYLIDHHIKLTALGAIAILLYNGIYTPNKHRISLSMTAGAFCGMIPPLIGWLAAGGEIFSLKIWMIMTAFGLWQLPHFWLVLLHHETDYLRLSFPNMLNWLDKRRLEKITFIWIANFAAMVLAIPVMFVQTGYFAGWVIASAAVSLVVLTGMHILIPGARSDYHRLFTYLNGTILVVMVTVISDSFIGA